MAMSTVSNYALYCQPSAISKSITALQARADTTFNNMSLKFRKNMKKRKNSDYDLTPSHAAITLPGLAVFFITLIRVVFLTFPFNWRDKLCYRNQGT